MRLGGIALVAALALIVMIACDDNGGAPEPTSDVTPTAVPMVTPAALTEYDFDSRLLVKGRDRLRACVDLLDGSVAIEEAEEAVREALVAASTSARWPDDWRDPAVDADCPLRPLALEETAKPYPERHSCESQVTQYMVFVFVGEARHFEERFPEQVLDSALFPGQRKAIQERIRAEDGDLTCDYDVSEAWYLSTPEIEDAGLLEEYALSIFPIADVGAK